MSGSGPIESVKAHKQSSKDVDKTLESLKSEDLGGLTERAGVITGTAPAAGKP